MSPSSGFGKTRTFFSAFWLLFIAPALLPAQPAFVWDKTLGGENYEELQALQVVSDGIIVGGSTISNQTFGDPADLSWNFLIIKLDFARNLLWQRSFGGDGEERLWMLRPTADGGFLAGGYSYSGISGDKTEASRGDMDVWVLRLDAAGNKIWDKTFGGPGRDELFAILEMPGGGFLLGCHTYSGVGGDKTEPSRGDQDFWLLNIDASGNLLWDKTLGGDGTEQIQDLVRAPDGNVLISGGSNSAPGTGEMAPDLARGAKDFWIGKFDPATRQLLWNHRFGGTAEDFPYDLCVSRNGKLYLGGLSASQPAPPTQYDNGKDSPAHGGISDYWLLELDADGHKLREWSFGGDKQDDLYVIWENKRGDLILGGVTDSDVSGNKTAPAHGGYDFWLLCFNPDSGVRWQQTLGGAQNDALTKVAQFSNGALVFGGHSGSDISFEKTENCLGGNDFWIISTECGVLADIVDLDPPEPCSGEPLTLQLEVSNCDSCLYQWNTGDTSIAIEVLPGNSGTFSAMALDLNGCMAADSIYAETGLPIAIELGPSDTLLVNGTLLTLGTNNPDWEYLWNDGSTSPLRVVDAEGLYAVTVTDANGCTASDEIQVNYLKKSAVWVPNVFSPNFDGYNDYISIYADKSVRQVLTFQISDRWGELCFRRDKFEPQYENDGWDGRFRQRRATPDVYTWIALIEYADGTQQWFSGDVTLVR